jgi:hypothetical protein
MWVCVYVLSIGGSRADRDKNAHGEKCAARFDRFARLIGNGMCICCPRAPSHGHCRRGI